MSDEQMPLWAKQFQSEMLRGLDDVKRSVQNMVTRDTFRDEKERVNGEVRALRDDLKEAIEQTRLVAKDLAAESTARQNAELAAAKKAAEEAEARQKVQVATNWQWLLIVIVPVVNWIFDWLRSGVGP